MTLVIRGMIAAELYNVNYIMCEKQTTKMSDPQNG